MQQHKARANEANTRQVYRGLHTAGTNQGVADNDYGGKTDRKLNKTRHKVQVFKIKQVTLKMNELQKQKHEPRKKSKDQSR